MKKQILTFLFALAGMMPGAAVAQTSLLADLRVPPVPANLQAPAGHVPYLKTRAIGTQNYVCVPGTNGAPGWKFLGPQATLYVMVPWIRGPVRVQTATHFLSTNPAEGETARPTWQHSFDTSTVWGKAVADSTDPAYVAPGAIPWLLVQAVGVKAGPTGGTILGRTTYIHRVNTVGGVAPAASSCDSFGKVALVPYETDYFFYQLAEK